MNKNIFKPILIFLDVLLLLSFAFSQDNKILLNTIGGTFEISDINNMRLNVKLNSIDIYKINNGEFGRGDIEAFFPSINYNEDIIVISEQHFGNCCPPIYKILSIKPDSTLDIVGEFEFWHPKITKGFIDNVGDVIEFSDCDEFGRELERMLYTNGELEKIKDDPFAVQTIDFNPSNLKSFIGQYPNQLIAKIANFQSRLEEILDSHYNHFESCFSVQTPIIKQDDFLILKGCQAHNCDANFADIYIDLNNMDIFLVLFSKEESNIYEEIFHDLNSKINPKIYSFINQTKDDHLGKVVYSDIPPKVVQFLYEKYPNWIFPKMWPNLFESFINAKNSRNPHCTRGDFDNNGREDFAIHIWYDPQISALKRGTILVFMNFSNEDKIFHVWDKDEEFDDDTLSKLILGTVKKESTITEFGKSDPYVLDKDGIIVSYAETSSMVYLFDGKRFNYLFHTSD